MDPAAFTSNVPISWPDLADEFDIQFAAFAPTGDDFRVSNCGDFNQDCGVTWVTPYGNWGLLGLQAGGSRGGGGGNPGRGNPPQTPVPGQANRANSPNSCLSDAKTSFYIHGGIDAAGAIAGVLFPGGNLIGVLANGGAGLVGFGVGVMDLTGSTPGSVGTGAALTGTGLGVWRMALAAEHSTGAVAAFGAKALPVVGGLISLGSLYLDYHNYQKAQNACMAGGKG